MERIRKNLKTPLFHLVFKRTEGKVGRRKCRESNTLRTTLVPWKAWALDFPRVHCSWVCYLLLHDEVLQLQLCTTRDRTQI